MIGSFANRPHERCEATGTFAGEPGQLPKGSFAEIEEDIVVTHDQHEEQSRVVDRQTLIALLRPIALDHPASRNSSPNCTKATRYR
jgi:hypothetical protein